MLASEVIDLQDCICVAKLQATNFGTFALSIADAWSTVTDACVVWCVLVTLFVPPRSVGLTFEVF